MRAEKTACEIVAPSTEVGGEAEEADIVVVIPTLSGLLCLSHQTQVPQCLTDQCIFVQPFAVTLYHISTYKKEGITWNNSTLAQSCPLYVEV